MYSQSVLIVGATGRTGMHIMQQLADLASSAKRKIFAFCRDAKKFDEQTRALCDGIIKGDAREPAKDLQRAADEAQADLVVVAVGNGDNVTKTDIRSASAKTLVEVLRKPSYKNVNVLVVSSIGAGESRIIA
jgi:putative NADH-flavin reductase